MLYYCHRSLTGDGQATARDLGIEFYSSPVVILVTCPSIPSSLEEINGPLVTTTPANNPKHRGV